MAIHLYRSVTRRCQPARPRPPCERPIDESMLAADPQVRVTPTSSETTLRSRRRPCR
jgi:hypothetical protein